MEENRLPSIIQENSQQHVLAAANANMNQFSLSSSMSSKTYEKYNNIQRDMRFQMRCNNIILICLIYVLEMHSINSRSEIIFRCK